MLPLVIRWTKYQLRFIHKLTKKLPEPFILRWQDDEPKNSHCKKHKYPNIVPDHCLSLLFTHTIFGSHRDFIDITIPAMGSLSSKVFANFKHSFLFSCGIFISMVLVWPIAPIVMMIIKINFIQRLFFFILFVFLTYPSSGTLYLGSSWMVWVACQLTFCVLVRGSAIASSFD